MPESFRLSDGPGEEVGTRATGSAWKRNDKEREKGKDRIVHHGVAVRCWHRETQTMCCYEPFRFGISDSGAHEADLQELSHERVANQGALDE